MAQKDERVKIMNEILSGIKVIIILHGFCLTPYLPPSLLRSCPNRVSFQKFDPGKHCRKLKLFLDRYT